MKRLLIVITAILIVCDFTFAISLEGQITLTVTNQPATRALIVFSSNGVEKARTITGDDGRYSIRDIPDGTYNVKIMYRDNKPTEYFGIVVGPVAKSYDFKI
jgi:Carboxypeptidase regulatory-like domain